MNAEWKERLSQTVSETENAIRNNENEDYAKRISELTDLLN